MDTTRRRFLRHATLAGAAFGAGRVAVNAAESGWPIAIFEKVFEGLSYDELADAIAQITADGVAVKPVMDEGRIALAGIVTGIWFIFWAAMTLKAIFGKR